MLSNFACFLSSVDFVKLTFSRKKKKKKKKKISIRNTISDVSSGLIMAQTVCKDYQQTTKIAISGKRVKTTFSDTEAYFLLQDKALSNRKPCFGICEQSDQRRNWSLIEYIGFKHFISDKSKPLANCADLQADLRLTKMQMSRGRFLFGRRQL